MKPEIIRPFRPFLPLAASLLLGAAGAFTAAACTYDASDPDIVDTAARIVASPDCSAPAAIPDDGLDDRAAIQTALDDQGCVRLGSGVFDVGINPGTGQAGIASLHLRGETTLTGAGPATVLHFVGQTAGDWRGIRLYGAQNLLADLAIDTDDLVSGDEQSHAVEVIGNSTFGPADTNTIRGVWFRHPPHVGEIKGDCLRLLGESAYPVTRTLVTDSHFVICKRSAIAIQRGAYDWVIADSTFVQSTDQIIDGEQSGGGTEGPRNGRGTISGNTFFATSGKYAMQFSGTETVDLVISSNTIIGQGLQCYNCGRTVLDGNVITHAAPGSADASVVFFRHAGPAIISNNVIERGPGDAAAVLSLTGQSGDFPSNIVVTGNRIRQATDAVGINVLSTKGLSIVGNLIELAPTATGPHGVKVSRTVATDPLSDDVVISANALSGPWQIGVTLQGTARATLHGNSLTASPGAKGLSCNASTTGPVVSSGNNWTASSCAAATAGNL